MRTGFIACWLFAASSFATKPCAGQTQVAVPLVPPAYTPPTASERFQDYRKSIFGVEVLLRSTAGSGISQLTNTPSEWGQGTAGYLRRYGNSYAQRIIRETIAYSASSVLHEDSRYFRSDRQGIGSRAKYAIGSTFLARRPDGSRRVSFSRMGAIVATAFISLEWQPHSTNGPENAFASIGTEIGNEVGFNLFQEFLPKRFRH